MKRLSLSIILASLKKLNKDRIGSTQLYTYIKSVIEDIVKEKQSNEFYNVDDEEIIYSKNINRHETIKLNTTNPQSGGDIEGEGVLKEKKETDRPKIDTPQGLSDEEEKTRTLTDIKYNNTTETTNITSDVFKKRNIKLVMKMLSNGIMNFNFSKKSGLTLEKE